MTRLATTTTPDWGLRTPRMTRPWFIARLLPILGDCRLLWMPALGDTTPVRSYETWPGRVGTPLASVASQLSSLGRGAAQSFNGTSQYITFPDTANLSFGTGAADQAFSVVALANVTDTAAGRAVVTKWDSTNGEWAMRLTTGDVLAFWLTDQSAGVTASRASNAAITQGSWRVFGASYSGVGGATAADGIALYQDGAVIASTATNNAAYVAMEDKAAPVEVGSISTHTADFFSGSLALVAVCQKNLSAADHAAVAALCRRFYGVP